MSALLASTLFSPVTKSAAALAIPVPLAGADLRNRGRRQPDGDAEW